MDRLGRNEPNGLRKATRGEKMDGGFLMGITVHTSRDDGLYPSCQSGGCGEDVPDYFSEHEFVACINFDFSKRITFRMGERVSGIKFGLLVNKVSRHNTRTTGGPIGAVKGRGW